METEIKVIKTYKWQSVEYCPTCDHIWDHWASQYKCPICGAHKSIFSYLTGRFNATSYSKVLYIRILEWIFRQPSRGYWELSKESKEKIDAN